MNRERLNHNFASRRSVLLGATAVGGSTLLSGFASPSWSQTSFNVTMADIGVGDPRGDWSRFTDQSGHGVNLVAIGNAPSAVVNQLLAGGGRDTFDIIHIVGGMQRPLAEAQLIEQIDTSRLPNWEANSYINEYLADGTPGAEFIGFDGTIYGVPTILQADSFAYLPDETGELDSYGALFDPRFRGLVALEDNYTTAGQKTALYLKQSGLAEIEDPADMTPEELKVVIDFLIEQKQQGQFRVLWSSFEQAVNLLVSKEVHVIDCWEPMVMAANAQGANVLYASPKEGFLLWAMVAYIVNDPNKTEEERTATYDLLNFMIGPWYGATITGMQGYMTNSQAVDFAQQSDDFAQEEAQVIATNDARVKEKFSFGGTWQNRWPTNVDLYEEEWQRFKSA